MKQLILIGVAFLVSGCATSGPSGPHPLVTQSNQAKAECHERKFKTAIAEARCLNDAEEIRLPLMRRYTDLIKLQSATRLALAEKVDRKQITPIQANLEFQTQVAQIRSEMQRRRNSNRIAEAQEQTANANARMAASADDIAWNTRRSAAK